MMFDFSCKLCLVVQSVKGRIGHIPRTPSHCGRRMQRLYSTPRFSIQHSIGDYVHRAQDGSEQVPGMTRQEVRATVDTMKVTS